MDERDKNKAEQYNRAFREIEHCETVAARHFGVDVLTLQNMIERERDAAREEVIAALRELGPTYGMAAAAMRKRWGK